MSEKSIDLRALRAEVRAVHGDPSIRPRERRRLYAKVRQYYLSRRAEEATQREIAKELALPVGTLYRWIRAYWRAPRRSLLDEIALNGPKAAGK